jgi:hypothetical protein
MAVTEGDGRMSKGAPTPPITTKPFPTPAFKHREDSSSPIPLRLPKTRETSEQLSAPVSEPRTQPGPPGDVRISPKGAGPSRPQADQGKAVRQGAPPTV